MEVEVAHRQYVHLKVAFDQERPWYFTVVYGSPQAVYRNELWEGLRMISEQFQGDWCVGGDFNSVLNLNDTGGSSSLSRDSQSFNSCLLDCGLADIGFSGQPFTWQRNGVHRRLDHFVANGSWSDRFVEVSVKHLPRLKSDHIPILLTSKGVVSNRREEKPFRFMAPWLAHGDFKRLLITSWKKDTELELNI